MSLHQFLCIYDLAVSLVFLLGLLIVGAKVFLALFPAFWPVFFIFGCLDQSWYECFFLAYIILFCPLGFWDLGGLLLSEEEWRESGTGEEVRKGQAGRSGENGLWRSNLQSNHRAFSPVPPASVFPILYFIYFFISTICHYISRWQLFSL